MGITALAQSKDFKVSPLVSKRTNHLHHNFASVTGHHVQRWNAPLSNAAECDTKNFLPALARRDSERAEARQSERVGAEMISHGGGLSRYYIGCFRPVPS
jgi:hypothetical protein